MATEVRVKENESLDSALRRFKRQCALSGVMAEVRKREHYDKPSVKRKKKAEAARKKKRQLIEGENMTLKERLMEDMKVSMRNKETLKKSVITMIRASVKQKEVDDRVT